MLMVTPFLMLFLMFAVAGAGWLWAHVVQRRAGGVVIMDEPTGWRVRLPRTWPIFVGLGTTLGLGFIGTLFVGFATNGHPPLWLVVTATVVTYLGGVVGYAWQWRIVHSGDDDLVFFKGQRLLELPLTFGRVQRVLLHVADIQAVRVEAVEHHGRRGSTSYSYRPVLSVARLEPQVLADWSDKAKAEAFAGWLAKQLGVRQWLGA
jgi:hypothetical protein